jgi:hypothetical protein
MIEERPIVVWSWIFAITSAPNTITDRPPISRNPPSISPIE